MFGDELDASVEIDDTQEDDVSYFVLFVLCSLLSALSANLFSSLTKFKTAVRYTAIHLNVLINSFYFLLMIFGTLGP